jgi:outer membrane protein assembly factor BamB
VSTRPGAPAVLAAALVALTAACTWPQFGYDAGHRSQNAQERTINVGNAGGLHPLWRVSLNPFVDGSPAYASPVPVAGEIKGLVIVTSRGGDLIAFDVANGAQVWKVTFGPGSCRINNGATICYTTSSPVVDMRRGFAYTYGLDGYVHRVALATGVEDRTGGWPQLVTTKSYDEKGSSALSMATDRSGATYLYMTTAGYPGDRGDYQGHLVAINLDSGEQRVYNTLCADRPVHFVASPGTPDCVEKQSGVWARAGTIYDADNDRLYISSGNGDFTPASHHWGDTVMALHPDGTGANAMGDPLDTYTPANYATLQLLDQDLGSTLPAILPPIPGSRIAHVGLMSGKDAKLRLLDLDNLSGQGVIGRTGGELGGAGGIINVPQGGVVLTQIVPWTDPADGTVWAIVANNSGTSAVRVEAGADGTPRLGAVRWRIAGASTTPVIANGVLYLQGARTIGAYNPATGARLWSDNTLAAMHWQSPIVVSGRLFVADGTSGTGQLVAYGV